MLYYGFSGATLITINKPKMLNAHKIKRYTYKTGKPYHKIGMLKIFKSGKLKPTKDRKKINNNFLRLEGFCNFIKVRFYKFLKNKPYHNYKQ
jgi:hypothetical protein